MGVRKTWEEALKFFEDPQAEGKGPVGRLNVAGDKSPRWIGNEGKSWQVKAYLSGGLPQNLDGVFDIWWSTAPFNPYAAAGLPGSDTYVVVAGCTMDWTMFNSTDTAYSNFRNDPEKNLVPLVNYPYKNRNTDLWTFEHAVDMLHGVNGWFDTWIPSFKSWADGLDQGDSEWSGNAAGELKKFLNTVVLALTNVKTDLTAPTDYAAALHETRDALGTATLTLYNGFHSWLGERCAGAVNALHDAFIEAMGGAYAAYNLVPTVNEVSGQIGYTFAFDKVTAGGLDVGTQAFWDKVETDAKNKWLQTVATVLDPAAHHSVGPLDDRYTDLAGALRRGIIPPDLGMPKPSTGTTGLTDKDKQSQDLKDELDKQLKDITGKTGGAPDITGGLGGLGGTTGGGKTGPVKNSISGPLPGTSGNSVLGGRSGNPGLGSHSGNPILGGRSGSGSGTGELLDKDGGPVLDKDHQPIMVPPGSTIGPDGRVYGPTGKPVLGRDGKQIVAPPGSTVKEQPNTQNHGVPGAEADKLHLPEGSRINQDGTVVDNHGKPVLDSNGNPYSLPKGSTVNSDGVVVDDKGRPISRTSQLISNQEHALFDSRSHNRPNTSSSSGYSPGLDTGLHHSVTHQPGTTSGHPGSSTVHGHTPLLNPTSGMSEQAIKGGGDPSGNQAVVRQVRAEGEKQAIAAAEAAQQQAGTAMQPPMMPPMGGAGMPPGGGAGGKDRQRTTWLAEDEEVWGTETGSVSGVIGR
ncbi:DUF3659 domain-containing protein [Streptomyces sp.]|uniref:DUF3659 domain-containing protein n=1 Tax=Streptomyces sp. TaxID=1931 RepID=UPI002F400595